MSDKIPGKTFDDSVHIPTMAVSPKEVAKSSKKSSKKKKEEENQPLKGIFMEEENQQEMIIFDGMEMPNRDLTEHESALADPAYKENLRMARKNSSSFIEFCMVDPKGDFLVQSRFHEHWQDLFVTKKYTSIWSFVESGKTTQIVGYLLWRMGLNPNLRIGYICKNEKQVMKVVSELQKYISAKDEVGERVHSVFPNLVPSSDPQDPWNSTEFTIQRTVPFMKDPTFQAFGLEGNPISSRFDLVIFDDLLTPDSVASENSRDKTMTDVERKCFSRLTNTSQMISIGTPFHPDDFLHRIESQTENNEPEGEPVWHTEKFPVIDRFDWTEASLAWPEGWPLERVNERKNLLSQNPAEFARTMLCEARDDEGALFQEEDIRIALVHAFDMEIEPIYSLDSTTLGHGFMIVSGVDLGIKQKKKSDTTCILTSLIHPDQRRQPLWIERGKWGPKDIVAKINKTYDRYRGLIQIEDNQGQDYIVQLMADERAWPAVRGFTTGVNKHHPEFGVEGISVELNKNMWLLPSKFDPRLNKYALKSGYPEFDKLIQEMLFYRRGAHTGDSLMALWICREAARMFHRPNAVTGVRARLIGGRNSGTVNGKKKENPHYRYSYN